MKQSQLPVTKVAGFTFKEKPWDNKNNSDLTVYIINVDGSCRPKNPGGIASAAFIINEIDDENNSSKMITKYSRVVAIGENASNNYAEYCAVLNALIYLSRIKWNDNPDSDEIAVKDEKIIFRSDSKMLVDQMSGRMKANSGIYLEKKKEVDEMIKKFNDVKFEWVPREKNVNADALAQKAYFDFINKKNEADNKDVIR